MNTIKFIIMKNSSFKKNQKTIHLQKRNRHPFFSKTIEEALQLTYPNFQKLFAFKKEELYQLMTDYLFKNRQDVLDEIEAFTNSMTVCHLEGYQRIIQRNGINSFEAFDQYLARKKAKSFAMLKRSLATCEILNNQEKDNIIGGRKSIRQQPIALNLYGYAPVMIA